MENEILFKYEIRSCGDREYAVYLNPKYHHKDTYGMNNGDAIPEFSGKIEEVNAWISLKDKGYKF